MINTDLLFIFFSSGSLLLYLIFSIFRLIHDQRKSMNYYKKIGINNINGHPPSYPFIGCLVSFYKNRYRLLNWYTDLLSQSPTQTTIVQRLGARRTIVTANPSNVEYILKTNFNNFPKGQPFTEILGDLLGTGIFNVDGELWRSQRKLASHGFTAKLLREYVMKTLEEEVEHRLFPILESAVETNKLVDLQDLLRRFAFDVICKVSLGMDPGCLDPTLPDSPLAKAFDVASEISARRGAAPVFLVWKMKRALGVGSEKKLKEAIGHVHACVAEIIHEKKKKNVIEENINAVSSNNGDLLSRLISEGLEEVAIRDMVISFIMAGRDTTSAVMTWLFWLLSGHTHIEKELVKEVSNKLIMNKSSSLDANYQALKEMRLLQACLCESMRLYPPVAWDSKHAISDDILPDGTPVKTGDRVTYFPYGMGRMEALWGKDRLEFKPDRWFVEPYGEEEEEEAGSRELKNICPYKFPVFQAGPRVCLGKEMALVQMKYAVASILKRFEIRPARSEEPVFVPLLTAYMAGGFNVKVQRRTSN